MTQTHDDSERDSTSNSRGRRPDPEVEMSNERTFLSWIRTALALVVTGAALVAFDVPVSPRWQVASGALFAALGVAASLQAWMGWRATRRALAQGEEVPAPRFGPALAGGVVLAVLVLAIGAVLDQS